MVLLRKRNIRSNELKVDPVYLTFAYFCPPGSTTHESWYSSLAHVTYGLMVWNKESFEVARSFQFHEIVGTVILCCTKNCISIIDMRMHTSLSQLCMASKFETGIKLYDEFCVAQINGRCITSFYCLVRVSMPYVNFMLNAAAKVLGLEYCAS